MIVVVQQHNVRDYTQLLDEMFRSRARVFHERLKWDVRVDEGQERDKYDDESPVYLIYVDDLGRVKGSLRLLPTTGPTLLAETFSDTLPDAIRLTDPTIWECTRFCVECDARAGDRRGDLLTVSRSLIVRLGEVALAAGIETILGNFDPMMLRIYRRIGCELDILGATCKYGGPIYLASFPVSGVILERIRAHPCSTLVATTTNAAMHSEAA